jgi:hypothetical protein
MKGRGGGTAVRGDDLGAVIGECGPNIDRYIRTNAVRAMVLRMTARPAIKTGKGKPAKKPAKPKPRKKTDKKK